LAEKILILSRHDRSGASSRVRLLNYVPFLESAGMQVDVVPFFDKDYLINLYSGRRPSIPYLLSRYTARMLQVRRYDLVWIEKEVLPYMPSFLELLFLRGVPYVVDYDDAWFHRYDLHRWGWVRWMLGQKMDRLMGSAKLVIAGNAYLVARALGAGASRIESVPSVVDLTRYDLVPPPADGPIVIGWIGSPSTAVYLRPLAEQLAAVCSGGRAIVRLIGSGQIDLPGVPTEILPWSEETADAELSRFHIGIMPLVDGPWERGKCGYKLIQYMAAGRPMVASPVGVSRDIVEQGVNGFLANTPQEWFEALETLRDQPELCRSMGMAGRAKVDALYSLGAVVPRVVSCLSRAARRSDGEAPALQAAAGREPTKAA
jgi:glycosyltransferase involved in cell wall biosynthesis